MPSTDDNTIGEEVIAAAAEISLFDASGNKIKFGSLFELQKTIVVFIRTWVSLFYCRLLPWTLKFATVYVLGNFFCGVS